MMVDGILGGTAYDRRWWMPLGVAACDMWQHAGRMSVPVTMNFEARDVMNGLVCSNTGHG